MVMTDEKVLNKLKELYFFLNEFGFTVFSTLTLHQFIIYLTYQERWRVLAL